MQYYEVFTTNGSQGALLKTLVLLDLPPPFAALLPIFVKYGINSETRILMVAYYWRLQ